MERYRRPSREVRVMVVGDLHVCPGQKLDRLEWIGEHARQTQPDYLVQIGDWSDFDSVSSHDPIGSIKQKTRPSLRQDLDAHFRSLEVFDKALQGVTAQRIVTLGNHEHRVKMYEEMRSELDGSVWWELLNSFAQFRWKTHDYGEITFIGGVGFVHVPKNIMDKPHSSPNIICHNLTHDLVYGHTHKGGWWTQPKIGSNVGVSLHNVGISLDHGTIKKYARLSMTGWNWGITDFSINGGRIVDSTRTSMLTLAQRYGNTGDDIAA